MATFCPKCGKATIRHEVVGRERDICPDGHFVQFATYNNSAAALVFRGESVLLVQHNRDNKPWSLPGGYIEQEEDLALGLKREVIEESNIDIEPTGIIAIRNLVKETINELYIIFLCEADNDQVPSSNDPEEIADAQFIPLEKFRIGISHLSRGASLKAIWNINLSQCVPSQLKITCQTPLCLGMFSKKGFYCYGRPIHQNELSQCTR